MKRIPEHNNFFFFFGHTHGMPEFEPAYTTAVTTQDP